MANKDSRHAFIAICTYDNCVYYGCTSSTAIFIASNGPGVKNK